MCVHLDHEWIYYILWLMVLSAWINLLNSKLNLCKPSLFSWYLCMRQVATRVIIGTMEIVSIRQPSHYFSIHGDKHFKHLITTPWVFSRASPLGFYLVTVAILSNFKIQSKHNPGFPSKVGMSSFSDSLA